MIHFLAGLPAMLLAHPLLAAPVIIAGVAGYGLLLRALWRHEDRDEARRNGRRWM